MLITYALIGGVLGFVVLGSHVVDLGGWGLESGGRAKTLLLLALYGYLLLPHADALLERAWRAALPTSCLALALVVVHALTCGLANLTSAHHQARFQDPAFILAVIIGIALFAWLRSRRRQQRDQPTDAP